VPDPVEAFNGQRHLPGQDDLFDLGYRQADFAGEPHTEKLVLDAVAHVDSCQGREEYPSVS